jgi:hypothetical protein
MAISSGMLWIVGLRLGCGIFEIKLKLTRRKSRNLIASYQRKARLAVLRLAWPEGYSSLAIIPLGGLAFTLSSLQQTSRSQKALTMPIYVLQEDSTLISWEL